MRLRDLPGNQWVGSLKDPLVSPLNLLPSLPTPLPPPRSVTSALVLMLCHTQQGPPLVEHLPGAGEAGDASPGDPFPSCLPEPGWCRTWLEESELTSWILAASAHSRQLGSPRKSKVVLLEWVLSISWGRRPRRLLTRHCEMHFAFIFVWLWGRDT